MVREGSYFVDVDAKSWKIYRSDSRESKPQHCALNTTMSVSNFYVDEESSRLVPQSNNIRIRNNETFSDCDEFCHPGVSKMDQVNRRRLNELRVRFYVAYFQF